MLIRPISDIHLEFYKTDWKKAIHDSCPELETDKETVLTIAGDLGLFGNEIWIEFLKIVSERFKSVVYTPGNHEFYGNSYFPHFPKHTLPKNVHLLYNDHVMIDDILFLGATLWTDFGNSDPIYMYHARKKIGDYNWIKKITHDKTYMISPEDTVVEFDRSKNFIFEILKDFGSYKSVVITHHSPIIQSIKECYRGDILNYAFSSDLDNDIYHNGPSIWHFGHQHGFYENKISKTILINNSLGYPYEQKYTQFNQHLVIEI